MSSPAVQIRSRLPRLSEEAVTRARLRVVPRTRTRATRVPFVLLVSLLLVGGVVGLLMFNTSMQQASFAASDLEDQASTLTAREQNLKMELEDLRNPQRVAVQASRLGMVLPTCTTFLGADGSVVGPAQTEGCGAAPLRLEELPPVKPAALSPERIIVPAERAGNRSSDTSAGSPGAGRPRDKNDRKPRTARH